MDASSSTPKWILVVEDDEALNNGVTARLAADGYKCVSARKATDAIAKLAKQRFDCVILDLKLDQQSGELVLDSMRSDRSVENYKTPVLILTGFAESDVIKRICKKISSVLVKPVTYADLAARLTHVLIGTSR